MRKRDGEYGGDDARWSLRDIFEMRPDGEAGKVWDGVWGTSYAEYGEIAAREALDRQNASPDKHIRKIRPRGTPRGPKKRK